jgi:cell division protein FtsI/penicillin-binding protein 2
MLYYLFQYLEKFDFPGAGMFGYVSFRSLMAIILSLLISAIFGEYFINLLKDLSNWSRTALAWMSIGYETQIPPINTLAFYNAIANNGVMVKPRFVKSIVKDGQVVDVRLAGTGNIEI